MKKIGDIRHFVNKPKKKKQINSSEDWSCCRNVMSPTLLCYASNKVHLITLYSNPELLSWPNNVALSTAWGTTKLCEKQHGFNFQHPLGRLTSLGRARMIVRVVMSSATRVPAANLSLSTLLRHPTTYRGPLLAFTITAHQKATLKY